MEKCIKKARSLLQDFCIRLTPEQEEHLLSLTSKIAVDNFLHTLICGEHKHMSLF